MNFDDLIKIGDPKTIDPSTIVFTEKTREWCKLPYSGHPKGCPNDCPKTCPYDPGIVKRYSRFVLVWAEFDFKRYKEMRSVEHPGWTEQQKKCVLYWQSSVKKALKERVFDMRPDYVLGAGSGFGNYPSMEAVGVHVFKMLELNGIPFEVKPVDKVLMVSLAMFKSKKTWF